MTTGLVPCGDVRRGSTFYALYDKVYWADILSHAYSLVLVIKENVGIDGATFKAIEEHEWVSAFLVERQETLKSKTYHAFALLPMVDILIVKFKIWNNKD